MARLSSIFLLFLTHCLLVEFAYGLVGQKVYATKFYQFPFIVSIAKKVGDVKDIHHFHLCTGTLLRPRSILTVAHCLNNKKPDEIEVIGGSVDLKKGEKYPVESWTTFDQWNHNPNWKFHKNDIAVIILQGEGIKERNHVSIPEVFYNNLNDHTRFTIAGWGETEKGNKIKHLKMAQLYLVSNEECSEKGTELTGKPFNVPENYFCSKAEPYVISTCGDGGDPILTKKSQLVGINIGACPYVEGFDHSDEVINQRMMNAHLHVSYYKDFIETVWK